MVKRGMPTGPFSPLSYRQAQALTGPLLVHPLDLHGSTTTRRRSCSLRLYGGRCGSARFASHLHVGAEGLPLLVVCWCSRCGCWHGGAGTCAAAAAAAGVAAPAAGACGVTWALRA